MDVKKLLFTEENNIEKVLIPINKRYRSMIIEIERKKDCCIAETIYGVFNQPNESNTKLRSYITALFDYLNA